MNSLEKQNGFMIRGSAENGLFSEIILDLTPKGNLYNHVNEYAMKCNVMEWRVDDGKL